jgi:DNA-binding LacI/PurR family transcriptional regulator
VGQVRLIDVAKLAGVSMKTVSNVVHDYQHVSPKMRERVQLAIDQLGYRPNLSARRLVTGRTGMIALAIPETNHPYFSTIADAVVNAAAAKGYRVLIEQTDSNVTNEQAVLRDREAGLVDGVIFQPSKVTSLEISQLQSDTPLVLLGEAAIPLTVDHVMIDNVAAARAATKHLLSLGCKRIAFLGDIAGDLGGATVRRLTGFQSALSDARIVEDQKLVLHVTGFSALEAKQSVILAIQSGLEFDGILCRDDRFAVGALQALRECGLVSPRDVKVIGWDDSELAQFSYPTLTSISPNREELAKTAVELLIQRIEGHRGIGRHEIVPFTLLTRESAPAH